MGKLILSRRRDEVIVIEPDIRVTVCDLGGGRVKLGIEAPGRKVLREECWAWNERHDPERNQFTQKSAG